MPREGTHTVGCAWCPTGFNDFAVGFYSGFPSRRPTDEGPNQENKEMWKYTRKSNRKLVFTAEILDNVRDRLEQGESKRSIAKSIGVNEATLRKRLKAGTVQSLGHFAPVFTEEIELDDNLLLQIFYYTIFFLP
ncbi:hypothetical protein ABEB36_004646 [Hypothenemus hampei]|uniref:HTH psq-type domain-containing protein n=1 Tax=Hypothenemus hampei TaxID=57062 RepID=A0ABD1F428_HYPHA